MARRRTKFALAALLLAVLAGGGAWAWHETQKACCAEPGEPEVAAFPALRADRPKLGLMTSLPLYWSLESDFSTIASGNAEEPWQRQLLERSHELVLLDTLSPIPGLTPEAPESDPLAGLQRLAIVQPRGLSPADNVALDRWVRDGGRLLLVLDPMLTGHHHRALGDPRRPADVALIPPVVGRWGFEIEFDEDQAEMREFEQLGTTFRLALAGAVRVVEAGARSCRVAADEVYAQCPVGEGQVTLFADAALFEGEQATSANNAAIQALMDYAFEDSPS
ncbi:MAG: DUF4350 domain-containing protein [Erythrobacter sp.]